MCLNQECQPPKVLESQNIQLPVSPWSRILKQVSKSKLRQTSTINLNKYWSKFGELMASPSKAKVVPAKSTTRTGAKKQLDFHQEQAKVRVIHEDHMDAIRGRYEVLDLEISENMANEIKEMWSFKDSNKVCKAF